MEFTHRQTHASDHTTICLLLHKLTASRIVLKSTCCIEIKSLIIETVHQIHAETNKISIAIPLLKAGDIFCFCSIHVHIYLQSKFLQRGTSFCFNMPCRIRTPPANKKKKSWNFIIASFLSLLLCKYLGCEGWCKKSTVRKILSLKYSKLLFSLSL